MVKEEKNKKYDWDLEALLANKSLDELFNEWKKHKDELVDLYKDFYKSLDKFINWTNKSYKFTNLSNRLANYIHNNLNEDVSNPKWIMWSQKLSNESQDLEIKTANATNLMIKNEKKIREYLADKRLKEYLRDYEIFFKSKKRILPEKEEVLLSKLSLNDSGYDEVFSILTTSTIKFKDILDSNKKQIKINNIADVTRLLKSKDRVVRKNVWYSFNNAFFEMKEVLSTLLYYNYLCLNTNSEIRKYKDYVESACDNDEVKPNLILNIYKNVENYKVLYSKFYSKRNSLIKKLYSLDKVEPWDKSLELVKKNTKYSIETAQKIVLEALSCFGEEYVKVVNKAFDERWISWLPKKNKQTGAYSIGGTRGLDKYYISMNFDNTLSSVYTLAHELGHSLHSYYFGKHQKVHASCRIFYAEIASITNEVILSLYLLEKTDNNQEKLNILDELITGFFAATTRQIIFSNFEYEIVEKIKNKIPITYDLIKEIYIKMNEKYSDSKRKLLLDKKYECAISTILRISHFYAGNFYVYKYAIGQVLGFICGYKIFNKDQQFIKKYFDFLKSGSSLSPIDTIKLLGFDFYKDDAFCECYSILENFIKAYNKYS